MSGGGPVGRREVAVRCFAAEYDDATLEYSEGEEERAPNYVVTPTGARINRLFVVGVLTEVESVSDDVIRGRVVDPTGAFVVYAGQYQPDAKAALERIETPAFVAVTGKARTFRPDDGDRVYTSVRPESVNAVDADTRDRWTVQTAEQTLSRVATAAAAIERPERGEELTEALRESGVEPALAAGLPRAFEHYGTTGSYLAAVRTLALQAAEVVAGEREEVEPLELEPDEGGPADVDLADGVTIEATASGPETVGASASAGKADLEVAGGDDVEDAEAASAGGTGAMADDVEAEVEVKTAGEERDDEPPAEAADVAGEGAPADTDGATVGADEPGEADESAESDGSDELYQMDEDEREEVEAEYGTEFETGNEVDGPGEADIETPGAEEGDVEAGRADDADEESAAASPEDGASEEEGAAEGDGSSGAEDGDGGDPVDAVVAVMRELDDGDGADRDAVVESVAGARGMDEAAVEDAIDEALMEGRCYEPDDGRLKAI